MEFLVNTIWLPVFGTPVYLDETKPINVYELFYDIFTVQPYVPENIDMQYCSILFIFIYPVIDWTILINHFSIIGFDYCYVKIIISH